MCSLRGMVLLVLVSVLSFSFFLIGNSPATHAQSAISSGCAWLNDPARDAIYVSDTPGVTVDFYRGETISITGQDPVLSFGEWIYLYLPEAGVTLWTTFPGTISYTFPANISSTLLYTSQITGHWTWTVSCVPARPSAPAAPRALPGCDVLLPIPSTSVVGLFVDDTAADYAPGAPVTPPVILAQGKTAWVLGVDATHSYYKIAWSCQYLWVPVSTMGPNPDSLWQGWPLPEIVVG